MINIEVLGGAYVEHFTKKTGVSVGGDGRGIHVTYFTVIAFRKRGHVFEEKESNPCFTSKDLLAFQCSQSVTVRL